jgi:hypothetical protein
MGFSPGNKQKSDAKAPKPDAAKDVKKPLEEGSEERRLSFKPSRKS